MTTASVTAAEKSTPWWIVLIEGIAAILIGILLVLEPDMTTAILLQVLGLYWLISGILSIVRIFLDKTRWGLKLAGGILGIIAGLLVLQHPLWSTMIIPTTLILIVGVIGIVVGIVGLIEAFTGAGWGAGVLGILAIIFGILLLLNPVVGATLLPVVLGIAAIVGGVAALFVAWRSRP